MLRSRRRSACSPISSPHEFQVRQALALGARQHGVELLGPQGNPQCLEVLKDLLAQLRRRRRRRRRRGAFGFVMVVAAPGRRGVGNPTWAGA